MQGQRPDMAEFRRREDATDKDMAERGNQQKRKRQSRNPKKAQIVIRLGSVYESIGLGSMFGN